MKNRLRLKEIFMIFDHENVLMRTQFWNTTSPMEVTPRQISLSWLSYNHKLKIILYKKIVLKCTLAWCNSTPYMSTRFAWSKKLNSASAGS